MKFETRPSGGWLVAAVVIIGVGSVGCFRRPTTIGTSAGSGNTTKTSAVVSPLVSQVEKRERLLEVSSLEIAPPTVNANVKLVTLSAEEAQAVIVRTAQEIMTLKITSGKAGARGTTDAILRTDITQFQERNGSAFGGEPATVSFRMEIFARARPEPIWEAQYFYRQEALTDNLLRLGERIGPSGEGAGWASGQVLFERGISAALQDFNRRREQQFVAVSK